MKKKSILVLALILTMTTITVLPISAKKPITYQARGTIDSYADAWSSEVISGSWSVRVKGDKLTYTAMYRELNLDEIEDSPVGSVDIFTHKFTTDDFEIDGDVLTFEGWIQVKKVWVKLDWKREVVRWDGHVTITITPDTYYLDSDPQGPGPGVLGQDWDRLGTTTRLRT